MDPDLFGLELRAIDVIDRAEAPDDLHHAVFPHKLHVLRGDMIEYEHRLSLDFSSRELSRQVDGGLLAALDAGALPVESVGGVVPAIVTTTTLKRHVDDLLDDLAGLYYGGSSKGIFSGAWLSNRLRDPTYPSLLFLRVFRAHNPLIILRVHNIKAVLFLSVVVLGAVDVFDCEAAFNNKVLLVLSEE